MNDCLARIDIAVSSSRRAPRPRLIRDTIKVGSGAELGDAGDVGGGGT